LTAHLDPADRLILIKADGSVLVHADGGSYKPLNWMSPPCRLTEDQVSDAERALGVQQVWEVRHTKTDDRLRIQLWQVYSDVDHALGPDPGLVKDGVEAHLQALLAANVDLLGADLKLVRREYPTPVGPVDLLVRHPDGGTVAVEVKRRGEIDGVEQLTRYVELLDRDPHLTPVRGVFAAQEIKPQARVLAQDRGFECVVLDYDAMRGLDDPSGRLF
jgi:RecB family endonuclease NucS